MIHLEKWHPVPDNENLEVTNTGDYLNDDLVLCNKIWEKEPSVQFQAQFIEKWNQIYQVFSFNQWFSREQVEREYNEPTTTCWKCWQVHSSYNYCNNCNTAAYEEFTDHP